MQGTCLKTMVHMKLRFHVNILSRLIQVRWHNFCLAQRTQHAVRILVDFCRRLWLTSAPMPCALDQAVVVHDPLHRWVSCFTVAFNDGRKCLFLRFWECFVGYAVWRLVAMEANQKWCGSACIHLNGRILLYVIQGSLTDLHCGDEIMCPLIHCALQAMGPGATLCRTTMPLITELR